MILWTMACATLQPCASVDPADCEAVERCQVIDARAVEVDEEGELCLDWSAPEEPVGCMRADQGCDDATVWAIEEGSRGMCMFFSDMCLPPGWVICEELELGECES